jgi:hypothetical protein
MYNNTYNKQQLTLLLLLLFLISMTIIYIIYSIHVYIENIDNYMIFGCPKMEDTSTYGKLNS